MGRKSTSLELLNLFLVLEYLKKRPISVEIKKLFQVFAIPDSPPTEVFMKNKWCLFPSIIILVLPAPKETEP